MRHGARLQSLLLAALLGALLSACATPPTVEPEYRPRSLQAGEEQTIALLGATGMVGRYLLEEALSRGYGVRALARTPAKLDEFKGRISIVQGDARDPDVIAELLRGSDVVVSALGPVKADGEDARFVSTRVSGNIVQSMGELDVSRYLAVSGGGVVARGDRRNLLGWWIRTLVRLGLPDVLADKQAEYELLSESEISWTLVRCPLIDAEPFLREAESSLLTPPAFRLRAGELASFILDELAAPSYLQAAPFLGSP